MMQKVGETAVSPTQTNKKASHRLAFVNQGQIGRYHPNKNSTSSRTPKPVPPNGI
jgi:hypothetical protein